MNYLPPDEAKAMLLNILFDFVEGDVERLFEYFAPVGFDVPALDNSKQIPAAWLGHYRIGQGTYDRQGFDGPNNMATNISAHIRVAV